MELQSENTGRIVAIQHELVMSIGLDLDLNRMLTYFMQSCLQQLDVNSVHAFLFSSPDKTETLQHLISLPVTERAVPELNGRPVGLSSSLRPVFSSEGDQYDVTFSLKNLGYLVLRSQARALDQLLAYSLIPIMDRLAISCQACLDHQHLLNEIEARRQAEAAVLRQSSLDSLTNLPNRRILYQRLSNLLTPREGWTAATGAVLFIDIDRFKQTNDTLGHLIGDQLLVQLAGILEKSARDGDFIARLAGDEFVMVINRDDGKDQDTALVAQRIAERILDATAKPLQVREYSLNVSLSVGIALFPQHVNPELSPETNAENLVRFADTAMFSAKQHGRERHMLFSPEMQTRNENRLCMVNDLGNT